MPQPPSAPSPKRGAADKANMTDSWGEIMAIIYMYIPHLIESHWWGPHWDRWRLIYSQSHWQQIDRPLTNEGNEIILQLSYYSCHDIRSCVLFIILLLEFSHVIHFSLTKWLHSVEFSEWNSQSLTPLLHEVDSKIIVCCCFQMMKLTLNEAYSILELPNGVYHIKM